MRGTSGDAFADTVMPALTEKYGQWDGLEYFAKPNILDMDVETIVPGHGPITDKKGATEVKGYLEYIYDEARKRYEAGMPVFEAAKDIPLDRYASWSDGERIVVNVAMIYRELSGDQSHPDTVSLFAQMAPLAAL